MPSATTAPSAERLARLGAVLRAARQPPPPAHAAPTTAPGAPGDGRALIPLKVAFAGVHRSVPGGTVGQPNGSWPSNSHNWASAFAAVTVDERRGRNAHGAMLPPAPPAPAFEVVAVYDAGEATREEFRSVWTGCWGDIVTYSDFDAMLAAEAPDILVVGTRQTYHAEHIVGALRAGVRGVLCDKPLVTSLVEADQIFEAFEAAAAVGLAIGGRVI
jgi:hypothetical protein